MHAMTMRLLIIAVKKDFSLLKRRRFSELLEEVNRQQALMIRVRGTERR